ncbi:hypothetical protein EV102420_38_00020 [Pseudescherichia vulneris NBRC 102420]|uniref:Lipoprotein n=1 Tax=Pseudescherichia vulneris NBRC 102420 TaxID=1115515 RepID=A0A090VAN3_PSEVU|nr:MULTISPECIES: hypothetical protein [Enterobacteriaceae]POU00208.1 hypothetical protein C3369_15045 [Escherichia sp. ESNIH1]GAL60399.1 hypothetical protein EV102420_38_00020 [Pseudescherichia vulneris NBRC 102420]STQ60113.1 Uncharacterised protein [Pseudescherichia vulneris]
MKKILGLLAGSILLSGCATIVGDDTQLVQVNSEPTGVQFQIKDETGATVAQGTTPQGVTLAKSDGSYFGKKSYQITMGKDGFSPVTLPIKASANGWYIGGNIVFGGLIGWLAVDPFNGGMYTLKPKQVTAVMVPQAQ